MCPQNTNPRQPEEKGPGNTKKSGGLQGGQEEGGKQAGRDQRSGETDPRKK